MPEPAPAGLAERWVLAVDFGTTNTVAAIGDANGVRMLTVDGKTIMPSAVLLEGGRGCTNKWLVGEQAVNMARRRMEWFERSPKRHIPDGSLLLGDRDVPVVEVVAAVLRVVVDEAAKQQGSQSPEAFVVTHPANWPESRVEVLKDAARTAVSHRQEWPAPEALPEPVAAAERTLGVAEVPTVARIVVLDLGGGTVDAATVDVAAADLAALDIAITDPSNTSRPEPELTVVGRPTGMDGAGGEDFDYRLAVKMTEDAGAPGLYKRLAESADPDERERAVDIRSMARAVKEELSRQAVVPASLPKSPPDLPDDTPVQVSRPQLEELIKGGEGNPLGLADAVALATEALRGAPQDGPPFAGVYLVGGSSRIPMLGMLVQQATGKPPITGGDPSTTVADGAATRALRLLEPAEHQDHGRDPPPPWWRRVLTSRVLASVVALLMVGGALAALTIPPNEPLQVPPTSPPAPPPTTSPALQSALPASDPTLAACPTAEGDECKTKILAAAHAAWPTLPEGGCKVNDSLYGVDAYSAECQTSPTTIYLVFWRRSGSLVSSLTGQMMMPTTAHFMLPGSSEKLGSQVGGTRSTPSGMRYTCAWEYQAHPVTMVLDGPNENGTVALCGTAEFLDSSAIQSALGAG
ncbi:Hsp70 protein [Pseudonocardia hierapolitana]|uniref:Hsp70 protein n=1 Tax=Pseudonocardia hierapolitana TaxID=1128676 RepID=A0A561SY72_9PSEU|nr:Hsp70 family protein [Pseudonocardia hierapolitana]TWF79791.1 Hsp70 protein [Pseudonocardia hierapolitana]